jgi:S1-C subfamily serine protease
MIRINNYGVALCMLVLLVFTCDLCAKKAKLDMTPHKTSVPYTREQIVNYLNTSELSPIEGEWILSTNNLMSFVISGKNTSTVSPHPNTDEYYIIKDDFNNDNKFLLVYSEDLDQGKTYTTRVRQSFGVLDATITKDIYDSNKYYFTFYSGLDSVGDYVIEMFINKENIRGSHVTTMDDPELGLKWDMKFDYLYTRKTTNNRSNNTQTQKYSGTGFLISSLGNVITNCHVIEGYKKIEVYFPDSGKRYSGSVQLQDKNNDLAIIDMSGFNILDISSLPIPYSIISSGHATTGQIVFTLGYPLTDILGASIKYSSGSITSKSNENNPVLMQIDNNIQPGNSGSPLFNSSGDVIGVVVSSLNAGYLLKEANILPQNVNFAIKSDYLLPLISDITLEPPNSKVHSSFSSSLIEDKIKTISPFIAIIYVEK